MKLDWTKDVYGDPAEAQDRRDLVKHSRKVLHILQTILEKKQKDYLSMERPGYEDAAWALRAADANGYLRALREVIDIVTPDPED